MLKQWMAFFHFILLLLLPAAGGQAAAQAEPVRQHTVAPGDTWTALRYRYALSPEAEAAARTHPNRQRQPAIGAVITLPEAGQEQMGTLLRTGDGGLLATAVRLQTSPWTVALQSGVAHPYQPTFHAPLFLPGGDAPPRDLPPGFDTLEVSRVPAAPGQALAFRARTARPLTVAAWLNLERFDSFGDGRHHVSLTGTGAFFDAGEPELAIQTAPDAPLWTQPWRFEDGQWTFQELTLTGSAAEIDQASIAAERERLFQIWSQATPEPAWTGSFQLPIDNFLEISSDYGARRSYNGGPYRTYHEGVDFSAYRGTPVMAPAAGAVVLAENLYVRGGAVIIDHGLGIYSGYYHLSTVHAEIGQQVSPGDVVGEVGTTGLSTGNHLHWDLLVNGVWVDAAAWMEQGTGCWILGGLGRPCS